MAQRIRGQEVKVWLTKSDVPIQVLTDVRNFELTPKFTKLEEKYLGETSNRYDDMFDGVDFSMELHLEDPNVTEFLKLVQGRAQNRADKTKIAIQAELQFAVGAPKKISLPDCFFENLPLNVGGRSEYVTLKISGSCNTFTVIG